METGSSISAYVDLLKFLIPFLIAWNVWIHKMIISIDKSIAINDTRDAEVLKRLDKWDERFQHIESSIEKINIELAKRSI